MLDVLHYQSAAKLSVIISSLSPCWLNVEELSAMLRSSTLPVDTRAIYETENLYFPTKVLLSDLYHYS